MKLTSSGALAVALAWLGAACGSDGPGSVGIQEPGPESGPGPVADVVVTAPDTAIEVGDQLQLTATARDFAGASVDDAAFDWATGDAAVATVSETGLVTALAAGEVEIRATAEGVTGTLHLAIAAAPPEGPVTIGLEEVASGLDFPLYLTAPPNDPRLFIVEKGGTIPTSGRFAVHYTDGNGEEADPVEWPTLAPGAGIPSLGQDAAGELYLLSTDSRVFRIVPR